MRAYLVEDNVTIRDHLMGTLEALLPIKTMDMAETQDEGARWRRRLDCRAYSSSPLFLSTLVNRK